jgi:glucuronoarabinoxylan endo-1,4-beta-xylanase
VPRRSTGTCLALAGALLAAGCGAAVRTTGDLSVDLNDVRRTIDGFGASDAFKMAPLTAAQNTLFWDPTNGIGLSLLRVGVDWTGQPMGPAYTDARAASAFGVRVWAAPWSPPGSDKSNGSVVNGGSLNGSAYAGWAGVLASFAAGFQANTGAPLYAMSAQNEPDFVATWPSCVYSAAQMVDFVKVLGPLLHGLNPPVKLMAPEPDGWDQLWGGARYGPAILADPDASAAVDVLATHDYGHMNDSDPGRPAPPPGTAQPLWETEVSDETAPDPDIGHGIRVATWIHAAIVNGGASAWHYWWLIGGGTDGEGLLLASGDTTAPPKRLYTVGNFSKFVRPGYGYVGTTGTPPTDVLVSSYVSPAGQPVIVAINGGGNLVDVTFHLSGGAGTSAVTPYVTSARVDLQVQPDIAVAGGAFAAELGGQSVTTFVGR